MTKLYEITFEAEVNVTVEADSEEEAEQKARVTFRWTDVQLLDARDITILSNDDDEQDA